MKKYVAKLLKKIFKKSSKPVSDKYFKKCTKNAITTYDKIVSGDIETLDFNQIRLVPSERAMTFLRKYNTPQVFSQQIPEQIPIIREFQRSEGNEPCYCNQDYKYKNIFDKWCKPCCYRYSCSTNDCEDDHHIGIHD